MHLCNVWTQMNALGGPMLLGVLRMCFCESIKYLSKPTKPMAQVWVGYRYFACGPYPYPAYPYPGTHMGLKTHDML